jgi:serine/threonine-protein kinase HipA
LLPFPYSAEEQRQQAAQRMLKMSIQGVQPKLSAVLNIRAQVFEIVDQGGIYIIKPESPLFSELPANEDLTMRLAKAVGIETPLHGLIYCKDGSLSYVIRRFDRLKKNQRLAQEDFAQLSGSNREKKYASSMEKVAKIIETYTTFPALEKLKLFRLTLFSFLVGNEDMHLKNFSLITEGSRITLSPAYDLLNSTVVLQNPQEQMALPLNGRRNKLSPSDLLDYFPAYLQLPPQSVHKVLQDFSHAKPQWLDLIEHSFLSASMKEKYRLILEERWGFIFSEHLL